MMSQYTPSHSAIGSSVHTEKLLPPKTDDFNEYIGVLERHNELEYKINSSVGKIDQAKPSGSKTIDEHQLVDDQSQDTVEIRPASEKNARPEMAQPPVSRELVEHAPVGTRGSRGYRDRPVKSALDSEEENDEDFALNTPEARSKGGDTYVENEPHSFLPENEIEYIHSEKWYDKSSKTIWSQYDGPKILVVSNKIYEPSTDIVAENSKNTSNTKDTILISTGECYRPDRIAVCCSVLRREIARVAELRTVSHHVFLRPFKLLVPFQVEFERSLQEQETIYKVLTSKSPSEDQMEFLERRDSVSGALRPTSPGNMLVRAEGSDEDIKRRDIVHAERLSNGLRCLLKVLEEDLKDIMELRQKIISKTLKQIAYDELWHLFKPGDLVISRKRREQLYRVLHVTGGREYPSGLTKSKPRDSSDRKNVSDFVLDCFYVDFDGKEYGPVSKVFEFDPYDDRKPITTLKVYPTTFIPGGGNAEQETYERLVERGKRFHKMARVSHQRYNGLSLKEGDFRAEELNSDVMIDFQLADSTSREPYEIDMPEFKKGVIENYSIPDYMETCETIEATQHCQCESGCHDCNRVYNYPDGNFDIARRNAFVDRTTLLDCRPIKSPKFDKDRYVLLPYRVYGYALLYRRWYPLDIDLVEDVNTGVKVNSDGFDGLVLPKEHKRMVRALVQSHAMGSRSVAADDPKERAAPRREMDAVRGKGKGLVILLHGVPGVGKTSTAECVAVGTNRPLFPITCGDLGSRNASELEKNLESYFDLARKWGCVLLLDEADVFLGERAKGSILQNSLVSIFLRALEYYTGVLILTTNRIGEFDEAIKSRVHISLYYPPLDKKSAVKIWERNMDRIESENANAAFHQALDFNRKEIKEFAKEHWKNGDEARRWNGRQIKNAFQTAVALAEFDHHDKKSKGAPNSSRPMLRVDYFRDIAAASARFDNYLVTTRGTDERRAYAAKARTDKYRDTEVPNNPGVLFKPTVKETRKVSMIPISRQGVSSKIQSEDSSSSSSSDRDSHKGSGDSSNSGSNDGEADDSKHSKDAKVRKYDEQREQQSFRKNKNGKTSMKAEEERLQRESQKKKILEELEEKRQQKAVKQEIKEKKRWEKERLREAKHRLQEKMKKLEEANSDGTDEEEEELSDDDA